MNTLRVAAFCAYLAAWAAVAVGAIAGAIPRQGRRGDPRQTTTARAAAGLTLQVAAVLPVTMSLDAGPLRPAACEMLAALALAPLGAALYWWALRSGPAGGEPALATRGAYALVRHPMYLAFFALVMATGLLASGGWKLALAAVVYAAGTELRSAGEETDLTRRFGDEYGQYRRRTRWRWLPGLR